MRSGPPPPCRQCRTPPRRRLLGSGPAPCWIRRRHQASTSPPYRLTLRVSRSDFENTEDLWCSSECTPPCQGGGRGFKSRQVRSTPERVTRLGRVAQLVERAPEKREVTGSTPVSTTAEIAPWSRRDSAGRFQSGRATWSTRTLAWCRLAVGCQGPTAIRFRPRPRSRSSWSTIRSCTRPSDSILATTGESS